MAKFMSGGEMLVRVVAVDDSAVSKAAAVLTMANTMTKQNMGQMLAFQPNSVTKRAAEPPAIPEGATAFYATRIPAGDILTDNTLLATKDTDPEALGRAIIARVSTAGHTVLECLGQAATARALQAVIIARRGLLVRLQDVACVIASTYITQSEAAPQPEAAAPPRPEAEAQRGGQQAAGGVRQQRQRKAEGGSGGGGGGGGEGGPRRVLANRIVVLECAPRDPSMLRVRSTFGKVGI